MTPDSDATLGFRMANLEGQMQTVNERLRAVDRIDERVGGVMQDVAEIKMGLNERAKDEAAARSSGRRDMFVLSGTIIAAVISAAALILSQLPG